MQCAQWLKWPGRDECLGCLTGGGRPAETVSLRTVHWDTAVLHAVIRRKVAVWEQRHPGWELAPDMQRYWEDSTHPSKYVHRDTAIGRKLAWTRFRVERTHPRGRRPLRLTQRELGLWVASHAQFVNAWMWAMIEGAAVLQDPRIDHPALARAALRGLDVLEAEMDAQEAHTKEPRDE